MRVNKLTILHLVLTIISIFVFNRCTNSPSGAFEFNTTSYFINDKFHDSIPDSVIRKTYGYVISEMNGNQHSYKKFGNFGHNRKEIMFCTTHRHWEVIYAYWKSEINSYEYIVRIHRKSK